jgi:serine/threonine protein kinase
MVNKLGRYEILRQLARGATGIVYQARDPATQALVALKTFEPGSSGESQELLKKLFLGDAQSALRLRHPNIVTTYDAGEADGIAYVAMELLDGQCLRQSLVQRGPLPLARSVKIAADIARGLAYAHEHAIVHRNLKPSNVIITRNHAVKIGDFCTGSVNEAIALSGTRADGLSYVSPEQLSRSRPTDTRSDIFSLGAVLYEMLTRRPPFNGGAPSEIFRQVLHVEPVLPSDLNGTVPPELDGMVLMMLAKDPDRRVASAESVVRDLQRLEEKLTAEPVARAIHRPQPAAHAATSQNRDAEPRADQRTAAPLETLQAKAEAPEDRNAGGDFHVLGTDAGGLLEDDRMFADEYGTREAKRSRGALALIALAFALAGLGIWWMQFRDQGGAGIAAKHPDEIAAIVPQPPRTSTPRAAAQDLPPKESVRTKETVPQASSPIERTPQKGADVTPAPEPSKSIAPAVDSPSGAAPQTGAPTEKPTGSVSRPSEPAANKAAARMAPPAATETVDQPDKTALLVVAVSARDQIFIDGKPYPTTPPVIALKLAPGIHRVEVRNPSRLPYLNYVAMQDGETRRLRH